MTQENIQENINVLLIEDNPGDVKLLARILNGGKNPRFNLQHAPTLKIGLERLKSEKIDVLLLDLGLPDSNGIEAASKATAVAPDIPIIVLSDVDVPDTILKTIRAGVRDYFVKSRIKPEALIEAVVRLAARRRRLSGGAGDAVPVRHAPADHITRRVIRVLVVEDNPGDLALTKRMLASVKDVCFEITSASNLSSARENLRYGTDVVFLDLNLPDSQGLNTLRSLRAFEPLIPVIILTGMDDRQKAMEALANGAQDYLVKGHLDGHLLERCILRHVNVAA